MRQFQAAYLFLQFPAVRTFSDDDQCYRGLRSRDRLHQYLEALVIGQPAGREYTQPGALWPGLSCLVTLGRVDVAKPGCGYAQGNDAAVFAPGRQGLARLQVVWRRDDDARAAA